MKKRVKHISAAVCAIVLCLALAVPAYAAPAATDMTGNSDTNQILLDESAEGTAEADSLRQQLVEMLETARALKEEDYTEESWAPFAKVLTQMAKINSDNVGQLPESLLPKYIEMLKTPMDALVEKGNSVLDELQALLAKADALNEAEYTADSWSAFRKVRDTITDPQKIPEEYQQAVLQQLQSAVDQLVKKSEEQTFVLEDGTYAVNFTAYADPTKKLKGPYFSEGGRQALVKAEDGRYKVTFRKTNNSNDTLYQVLKQEYYDAGQTRYGQKAGTKNWIEGFDYAGSSLNATLKKGFVEENNQYWLDTEYDIQENYTDFTVELYDLSADILLFTATQTTTQGVYIDFDETTARKISLEDYTTAESMSYDVSVAPWKFAGTLLPSDFWVADDVSWEKAEGEAVSVISFHSRYSSIFPLVNFFEWCSQGEQIQTDNHSLILSFGILDEKDIVLGKTIYSPDRANTTGYKDTLITFYPKLESVEEIELTEDITGTKVITDTGVLAKSTKLVAEELIDDPKNSADAYSMFHNNLDSYVKDNHIYMYYWNYELASGRKSINTSQKVTMKFKIPEGWNEENIQLSYYASEGHGGIDPDASGSAELIGVEDGYYVVRTDRIGNFALYEKRDKSSTGEEMEDGTYTVPVSVYHLTNEYQLSMADRCVGDFATLVVQDGVKTLYMDYTSVENLGARSYMTKMWLYGEDMEIVRGYPVGTLIPVTFTSYYKNADGSFLQDDFNANSLNYYPKLGYVQLTSDAAQWPARFKVPVMDLIGGGNFEQDAWLTLEWSGAEKVSDDTPEAPIQEALAAIIEVAETAVKEEYTKDTWAALEHAHEAAAAAYENGSYEEMETAYADLRNAVESLETPDAVVLNPGLYTAAGTIADTEIVTGTRILVNEKAEDEVNSSADIYLNVQGVKTLEYYDVAQKNYVSAVLEKTTDEDGSEAITGVRFTLASMANSVAVQYMDLEGKVSKGTLSFTDFAEQSVNKETLDGLIAEANELLKEAAEDAGRYDPERVAALQAVIAGAVKVNQDKFAVQSEVEAQSEALGKAISNMTIEVNLEELKVAIAEAEKKDETLYTPKSWNALAEELEAAKALLDKEGVTGQEVEAEVLKLNAAVEGLTERADKTVLQAAYEEAASITDIGYAGWDDLQNVLLKAKAVLDDANATQKETDAQIQAIRAAVENLSGGIDKSVLTDLIIQAEALDLNGYSDESAAFFQAAITSAKAVQSSAAATQQEIDKQIQLLETASKALIQKGEENVVYNGTYTIDGYIKHAAADQDSMGNAALVKPMEVVIDGEDVTLRMQFKPLTTNLGSSKFTGYLAMFNYFPGWEGGDNGYSMPSGETPVPADVESYYENTYDAYNDPENGADLNVKGKLYPHYMTMPVDLNDSEIWVQVYVPVMEAINTGSGLQYAKLQLDWSTLTQVTGTNTEKSALEKGIAEANQLMESLDKDSQGYAQEKIEMLRSALAAANAVHDNLNVDQTAVDVTAEALAKAVSVFSEEPVETDKSELKKAIETADAYLNDPDVTYTETTRGILQAARDRAQKVYDNAQSSQTQINACVNAIDKAVKGLVADGTVKTELRKALDLAKTYLEATKDYSAAALEALGSLYEKAEGVYKDDTASQEEINAQVRILNYAVTSLKKVEEVSVDKSGLHSMLLSAANMAGREDLYTAQTIKALKKAITVAEQVYENKEATQKEVNAQASALSIAIINLEKKASSGSGDNGNGDSSNNNNNSNSNGNDNNNGGNDNNNNNSGLDISNLKDGVYAITGSMVKTDKSTASMSNEAINHTIKLTVKDGVYYLTLDFKGLAINSSFGYLSELKYFASGYALDKYGAPQGTLKAVTIDSYQKNTDGSLVKDNFGTNYPDQVTFPMISEALKDGYVPLQVFVPIMDAISSGTGTQPVFLKLDWSSLKAADNGDDAFIDNETNVNPGGDSSGGNGSGGSGTNGTTNPVLTPSDTTTTTTTGTGTGSGTTSLTSGTSSLSGGTSSLTSKTSSLKSGTSALTSKTSSLSGGSSLSGAASKLSAGSGLSKGTTLKSTSAGAGTSKKVSSGDASSSSSTSAAAVPAAMSLLAMLAGVFYKMKSRKLFAR